MTLGPAEAEDQLRDAMAIGIDRAILLETDGSDWDPIATAAAIDRGDPRAGGRRWAVRPDPVRQRVRRHRRLPGGIRVADALGRPIVTGVKALEVADGTALARREAPGGGWEVFEVPLPAVVAVKEGINLPRYPSVPGPAAGEEEGDRAASTPARAPGGPRDDPARPAAPRSRASAEVLGDGPDAAPRGRRRCSREIGRRCERPILGLVEHARRRARIGCRSRRWRSPGGSATTPGAPVQAVAGRARRRRGRPRRSGGTASPPPTSSSTRGSTRTRPSAWAAAIGQIVGARGAVGGRRRRAASAATRSSPTSRARHGPADGRQRRSTSPPRRSAGGSSRQRWAGSLLEDAWLDAPPRLMTVAAARRRRRRARRRRRGAGSSRSRPTLTDADLRVRVTRREAAAASERLADRRPGRRRRRPRRRQRRGLRDARGAGRAARRRRRRARAS